MYGFLGIQDTIEKGNKGLGLRVGHRGVIESSRVVIKPSSSSSSTQLKKLEAQTRSSFSSYVRNLTQKIVELLELNSIILKSIKKLIHNYTRTRLD